MKPTKFYCGACGTVIKEDGDYIFHPKSACISALMDEREHLEKINAELLEASKYALSLVNLVMAYAKEIPEVVVAITPSVGQKLEAAIAAAKDGDE